METPRRMTVYLEKDLVRALKLKSAETDDSLSDLVNEAVRHSLKEDAIDLEAIRKRKNQKERSFETFLSELHQDGLL